MKGLFSSALGYIMIFVIAIVIIAFVAWSRAPDVLANNLSKKLKVPVTIEDIFVKPTNITIDNIEIGNIRGGILPKAFSCGSLAVNAPLTRYLNDQIVIDEIVLDNVYLGLEFETSRSTRGNWTIIMSNLQSSTSTDHHHKSKTKSEPSEPSSKSKSVLIRTLVINTINVDLVYVKEGGRVQKLPTIAQIVLHDINSEEGFPMDQLMNSVLGQMLKSVFIRQNLQNMLNELLNTPQQQLNPWIEPFRGIFGK